ncbi:peptide/nickel transport system ATP-binding protein [Thermosporothrix hazakensis]|jgi:peptide/nickel transport system ATP-binding protein|uniref:Peptide/nickel transport system ATP-binding protein n=2 Tax=Thermosporothrix TaxID=768650 RepID=A0A326USE7_THEHA|nr:ABC transporter ATP-binding protein [Thermosporothrix hazakensis]PZW34347.1 peptide/nickel transport system ATP-binding protein [Thermosporothrix hazakensis]BBH85469.1 dipeptide/oligopeptide/nickel ABC transporter ATP-binding protein [Thermosporothrix sp. COM3]GCE46104.1 dipeptide/oligopeptide/nickel ABC transporter ATP-binding protein [Thermosporothrix hazakensis]
MDALLEVKSLSVDYEAMDGAVHAVKSVDLTLHRGEVLGLAGESGCGKSTLAFAIARLLRPPAMITSGQVIYYPDPEKETPPALLDRLDANNGIDIMKLSMAQLRSFRWKELAVVFQSAMNALNPVLSIGDQIIDVLHTHWPGKGKDYYHKRAVELLDLVGIAADRLRSYPHELSGGMRQRVAIAIALALRPELIIMDEPTTALDVVVQREILDLIAGLCREFNTALIFITHDLSLLLELSDRIAIMYAGNIVEQATSEQLYRQPRHPYSYGLLNAFPTLHGPRLQMIGIPGSPPDLRAMPTGCAFHPRCPMAFEACRGVVPPLEPSGPTEQLVACHLYNPRFLNQPPSTAQIARSYSELAERKRRR